MTVTIERVAGSVGFAQNRHLLHELGVGGRQFEIDPGSRGSLFAVFRTALEAPRSTIVQGASD